MTTLKKALVVVDMQPSFSAARDTETRQYVMEEILDAKQNGDYIVVLEYDGYGPTYRSIIEEVKPYNNGLIVKKWKNDGSCEVIEALNSFNAEPLNFIVVGINSDCCVRATVEGLQDKYHDVAGFQIEVVKEACNSEWIKPRYHLSWVRQANSVYHKKKQIVIVERKHKNWKQYAYG